MPKEIKVIRKLAKIVPGLVPGAVATTIFRSFIDDEDEAIGVGDLASDFNVSQESIESSLMALQEAGIIVGRDGKPVDWSEVSTFIPIRIRIEVAADQGRLIEAPQRAKRNMTPEGFGIDESIFVNGESYAMRVDPGGNEDSEIFLTLTRNSDHHILIAGLNFPTTQEAWQYGDQFVKGLESEAEVFMWARSLSGQEHPGESDKRIVYLEPVTFELFQKAYADEIAEGRRPNANAQAEEDGCITLLDRVYKSDPQGETFDSSTFAKPSDNDGAQQESEEAPNALTVLVKLFDNGIITSGQSCEMATKSFEALQSELQHARWQTPYWQEHLLFETPAPGVIYVEHFQWERTELMNIQIIRREVGGLDLPGFEEVTAGTAPEHKNGKTNGKAGKAKRTAKPKSKKAGVKA